MELFLKATAAVLLAVIFYLVISGHSKELSILLTVAVCCMVLVTAGQFIRPVVGFVEELQSVGQLNNDYLSILLKVVGIGLLGEFAALVCTDAGNGTLGKVVQMLASCVILWLSLPLLNGLLDLIRDILGEV